MPGSVPIVPHKIKEGGNTRTPSPRIKWCFTYYNYTINEIENNFVPKLIDKCKLFILQEEICPKTQREHLQGYIELKKKHRKPSVVLETEQVHWEAAKGSRKDNIKYCSKSDSQKPNGKRWISKDVRFEKPLKIIKKENLYPWQQEVVEIVEGDVNDRTIYWIWDENGNTGKTELAKYLHHHHGAILVGGSAADAKFSILEYNKNTDYWPEIVLYDVSRSSKIDYKGIEDIKNGFFFSSKYKSGMAHFNPPHLIVFANYPPYKKALSADRWSIRNLGKKDDISSEDEYY